MTGFASARGETLNRMFTALNGAGITMPGCDPADISTANGQTTTPEREQEDAVEQIVETETEAAGGSQLLDSQTRDE